MRLDNKLIHKAAQPSLFDKIFVEDISNLSEDNRIVENSSEITEVLNVLFSNITNNLKIPIYSNSEVFADCIKDSVLQQL